MDGCKENCQYCCSKGKYNSCAEGMTKLVGYTNDGGEQVVEGNAILLEKADPTLPELPYLHKYCYTCNDYLNLVKERWLVKFVDGDNKGFTTHRKVIRYYSKGIEHVEEEE